MASLGFAKGVTRISVWSNESAQTEGLFYSTAHTFYQIDPLSSLSGGGGPLQAPTPIVKDECQEKRLENIKG